MCAPAIIVSMPQIKMHHQTYSSNGCRKMLRMCPVGWRNTKHGLCTAAQVSRQRRRRRPEYFTRRRRNRTTTTSSSSSHPTSRTGVPTRSLMNVHIGRPATPAPNECYAQRTCCYIHGFMCASSAVPIDEELRTRIFGTPRAVAA